jgi:transcriptional regulator with XRE-family HTH domain
MASRGRVAATSPTPTSAAHRGLGRAVRELRAKRKMSQQELARVTGLHFTYLSGIENGRRNPSYGVILAVAQALDVTPGRLINLADRLSQ